MKRWQLPFIGAAFLVFIVNAAPFSMKNAPAFFKPKVVYGNDDRKNVYEVDDPVWLQNADSTVALFRPSRLETQGPVTKLLTMPFGTGMNLCPNEPFYNEEYGAACSGFLIAPNLIASAGHCLATQGACDQTRVVFGFSVKADGHLPKTVPTSDVYTCKKLIHSIVNNDGEDFAIAELDRPVVGHSPVQLRLQGAPSPGDPLVVMGHPSGLPLKISDNARVRELQDQYLTSNLDTFGGNSGSPVFNAQTGEVEGILVRGESDYIFQNGCRATNNCADSGCRGEDVTLTKQILPHIPPALF